MGTDEVTHVLHQAQDIYPELLEHLDSFAGILQGYVGRSTNHHRPADRDGLDQGDSHIAGAWRQINQKIIKGAPLNLLQELPDNRVQHGPAPDQRLIAGVEEAHGDRPYAMLLQRLQAVLADYFRLSARPQHERDVRTVYIAIQQAHFESHAAQRNCKVHGNGGLTDSTRA